ncbi:anhydro-N-acetylmuramic acid kinase [Teredinibacter purpureus]|uniref:anhydro-N-acetylmuramic acid kinase n=1 Tax=Teredinibacter purpureus TaxID=2731756 RepID=UPI0005F7EF66|nr:anhydro-N-acetylmuramic acid kinase [Teredinibacter purpureus]
MSEAKRLFIGLMSGTSVDSIDAALVEFSDNTLRLHGTVGISFEDRTRQKIFDLTRPGANEIDRMGALDKQMGILFARAVNQLLAETGYTASDITAIGSHGQTIRHRPRSAGTPDQFTLQIGDPSTITQLTGITTVADFRRRDMAAGGQGAPLAPTFHKEMFSSSTESRCILNIGGMSNVTYLSKEGNVVGFDTGPGNVLMDAWISSFGSHSFDKSGGWAAEGTVNQELLDKLLSHSFFRMPAPKSTGREDFDLSWVTSAVEQTITPFTPQDVQATLTELTAVTIANALTETCEHGTHIFVCGGGAHNTHLFERLTTLLPQFKLDTTEALNLHPDWVEAVAFAWLAMRTLDRKPGNIPAVTGASNTLILGGVYYA